MKKVLVTGGTGVLGSVLTKRLTDYSVNFCSVSRDKYVSNSYSPDVVNQKLPDAWRFADLTTGRGLAEAIQEREVVVHLASGQGEINGEPIDVIAARNLIEQSRQANVKHLVYISIVGIDKIPLAYYKTKLRVEEMIQRSEIPYTILRVTQFHNFMEHQIKTFLKYPIGFVPKKAKFQPIQLEVVADRLVEISQSQANNEQLQLGGKQIYEVGELVDQWCKITRVHKPMLSIPMIGGFLKSLEAGAATCPERNLFSQNWEEYLLSKYAAKNSIQSNTMAETIKS